ncbi:hypothetical protein NQ315_016847 [Exocentrus adspersus]|uniref:Uncharacterized protein n=1 Tax=Exocentrus adspersus TaxID=1586481 RepID=A0AAV8VXS7_9CUCU|nr:hypothetical protein NQ315_016847 [Exocentrus adspersus]
MIPCLTRDKLSPSGLGAQNGCNYINEHQNRKFLALTYNVTAESCIVEECKFEVSARFESAE